jgi:hypothetical protein
MYYTGKAPTVKPFNENNNLTTESWLIHKIKWFLIQFIKKYQSQYRYLGKYLSDRFFFWLIDNWPKLG